MDKNLLTIRRAELDAEVERLHRRLADIASERQELDIAERVIDRLAGAERNTTSEFDEPRPSQAAATRTKRPVTVRQMIFAALMDARQRGLAGRTPQEIRDYIEITYGQQIGQQINTTASRMWRDVGEIDKDMETGLFSLPLKEKPVDPQSSPDTSTGLSRNPEHGRKAGQGGGT